MEHLCSQKFGQKVSVRIILVFQLIVVCGAFCQCQVFWSYFIWNYIDTLLYIFLYLTEFGQVLDASPVHVKALYRRGMSYMLLGDFDEARNDFNKVPAADTHLSFSHNPFTV